MSRPDPPDNIALVHDRFPGIGGGEHFVIEAARVLDAPIYTMYIADGVADDIPDDVEVTPLAQEKYQSGLSQYALQWVNEGMNPLETLNVALDWTDGFLADELLDYDIIVSSAPLSKHLVPDTHQTIIHYPHSPPRWLFDLYRDRMGSFNYPFVRFALRSYAKLWRAWDKAANTHIDYFIANSEIVRDRVRKHYGRDASVVYPPATGDWRTEGDDGYFVTWSRLAPEKRIDVIAEAFTGLEAELVIAGDGQQADTIAAYADDNENITYRGFVDDIESLVARATAAIHAPKQEDFGLVGAETLSAGKPLLGVDEGFTREQVDPGRTGHHIQPTVDSIRRTVRQFDPSDFDAATIQEAARPYQYEAFATGLCETIEAMYADDQEAWPSEPAAPAITQPYADGGTPDERGG